MQASCHSSMLATISFSSPTPTVSLSDTAVQEERQRNREREGELEFSVGVNEEMPVEKILEAETAVELKTELHSDGGSAGNSVSGIEQIFTSNCVRCFLLWRESSLTCAFKL